MSVASKYQEQSLVSRRAKTVYEIAIATPRPVLRWCFGCNSASAFAIHVATPGALDSSRRELQKRFWVEINIFSAKNNIFGRPQWRLARWVQPGKTRSCESEAVAPLQMGSRPRCPTATQMTRPLATNGPTSGHLKMAVMGATHAWVQLQAWLVTQTNKGALTG